MTNSRMTNDGALRIGHCSLVIHWSFWFGHWSFRPLACCTLSEQKRPNASGEQQHRSTEVRPNRMRLLGRAVCQSTEQRTATSREAAQALEEAHRYALLVALGVFADQ